MNRHPSHYFIKFLLAQRPCKVPRDGDVNGVLETFGFPKANADYLKDLRQDLEDKIQAIKNYDPSDLRNKPSIQFIKAEEIYSLFHPDMNSENAARLLKDPEVRIRQSVEYLILGGHKPKDVAIKVNKKYELHLSAEDIVAYRHYYWNVGLVKFIEWRDLYEREPDKVMKVWSILEVGEGMALHRAGFNVEVESKIALKQMLTAVWFDFLDWEAQPRSVARTKAMAQAARAACALDTQLSQSDVAIKEALGAFKQFKMKHATKDNIPSIEDVAAVGNYTNSGRKLAELESGESS